MFSVGDHIIYGVEGVCRVDEVGRLKVAGLDKNRDYYRLTPYYRGGTIYTPVDGRAVMRPVISREALEDLLPRLPELEPLADMPTDSRTAGEYYRGILAEHNCERLLRLCKSLYQKQQALSVLRRGVSATELRNWKMAEELLFGRLVKGGAVKVNMKDGALSFEYVEAAPPALPRPEEGDGEAEKEPEVAE